MADGVLAALEDRRAALLSGHGAVVHAAGVGEAVELTALLEWACTVFWRAAAIGTPRTLGEAEVAQAREGLDWTRRVSS
ncbi:MAG: class II aldolase/adducin family protein [Actinomycetota bacterium]|nr:class II aldolase/adducin family protein [Actinomycetota bacterium]